MTHNIVPSIPKGFYKIPVSGIDLAPAAFIELKPFSQLLMGQKHMG
jgi:hypothetical protein